MEDISYIRVPAALSALEEKTRGINFGMPSEPLLGALLRVLAASRPGGRILELGTGTGIATAWLLEGMDAQSSLVSVDSDGEVQRVATEILGSDPRVQFITEDGSAFLHQQQPRSFDLVFADAMPGKYEGLENALNVVKVGGLYVIDDMLPQPNWPEGHAARVPILLETLAARTDFTMLPLVWSSGVAVAVRTC
jgi:predicted O-methyltransferase YrrM